MRWGLGDFVGAGVKYFNSRLQEGTSALQTHTANDINRLFAVPHGAEIASWNKSMFYRLLDLSDELKWNNFLNKFNRKFRDVYFRPEYHSLYENNGDGKAYCFFASG